MSYNIDNLTPKEQKRFEEFVGLSLNVWEYLQVHGIDVSFIEAAELTMKFIELEKAEDT